MIRYIDNSSFSIGVDYDMPYRKKPCLVVMQGNEECKYASFNDKESADMFLNLLQKFISEMYINRAGGDQTS